MSASDQAEREALIGELRRLSTKMKSSGPFTKHLMELDLTFPQLKTIFVLAESEPMSMSALAQGLGITLPACTHLVDKLVHAGFVARNELPGDRRVVRCSLTEKGRALFERFSPSPFEHPQVLSRLSVDDLRIVVRSISIFQQVMDEIQKEQDDAGANHDPAG